MSNNSNVKPTVSLCTLGCKVNQYESQAIAEDFERLGFMISDFSKPCNVYVINTCTVTGESDKKSRQMIRRARKTGGKDAIVIAAGCFTQAQKEKIEKITELDAAFGNTEKSKIADFANNLLLSGKDRFINEVSDIFESRSFEDMKISYSERTRAFVKIVDGCENKCSYCIIPSVRGKIRSRHPDMIKDELITLSEAGYKEIVLTGIETAAYGKDLEKFDLCDILEIADKIKGVERIRLGSLEPTVIKQKFIQTVLSCQHIVPHFHLSLQSGCDEVLKLMRRKYNTDMFYKTVCLLKESIPSVALTTDIIVGFPGETDEMFSKTCDFLKKCGFLYAHIFPYSKRDGTDAAIMENQVPEYIKKQRAAKLKEIMLETRDSVLKSFDGYETDVLFEELSSDGYYIGHTPNYIEAKLISRTDENLESQIRKCRLIYKESDTDFMLCELI
jgi:threonylcarbamoyladenosine tRNA methylthiotransferase MtaB